MKVLVTGGAGFIGSALIRHIINNTGDSVVNLDALTYAGNLESLIDIEKSERYSFEQVNICDEEAVNTVLKKHKPDAVMHLAAESHVDRSINSPADFMQTNIMGTYVLLEACRNYFEKHRSNCHDRFVFHHISTDEVYGSLGENGLFTERTPYQPNSPYSASKAASDHLVRVWHHTYGFPVVTTNCSNNYGSYQFPEKLIPVIIKNALAGNKLPIYGDGSNVRDWLYVDDHTRALYRVLIGGKLGEVCNIGGHNEKTNLDVVKTICLILDELAPSKEGSYEGKIEFVNDRLGHDRRYAVDTKKIEKELSWEPKESFETGIKKTVQWYIENLTRVINIGWFNNHCDCVLERLC